MLSNVSEACKTSQCKGKTTNRQVTKGDINDYNDNSNEYDSSDYDFSMHNCWCQMDVECEYRCSIHSRCMVGHCCGT